MGTKLDGPGVLWQQDKNHVVLWVRDTPGRPRFDTTERLEAALERLLDGLFYVSYNGGVRHAEDQPDGSALVVDDASCFRVCADTSVDAERLRALLVRSDRPEAGEDLQTFAEANNRWRAARTPYERWLDYVTPRLDLDALEASLGLCDAPEKTTDPDQPTP